MKACQNNSINDLAILLIDDDREIALNISDYFVARGHAVTVVMDGKIGIDVVLLQQFHLVIFDLSRTGLNGWNLCEQLRRHIKLKLDSPIIILNNLAPLDSRLSALQLGAEGRIPLPMTLSAPQQLAASPAGVIPEKITIGELTIDPLTQKVTRQNQLILLQKMPFKILLCLAESYPHVVSKQTLCHVLWGEHIDDMASLRSHLYQLRQALDKPFAYPLLVNLHNVGYTLSDRTNEDFD